ncbi:MAG: endonuclease/exonuclease/phosphatase family protein [Paludibacter sp.]|nr:endonuclease/exonuclease/phosphatase family protein [Paludibacter sp.]
MFRKIVRTIILLINIGFALCLLATLAAGSINPNSFPLISNLSLLSPYLLIVNILFFLFWIIRLKKSALVSGIVLLFSFSVVGRTYQAFRGTPDLTGKETTVKILTYNTMSSFDFKKYSPSDTASGYGYILGQNADIILLQEFCISQKPEYITNEDINKIFKNYKYQYIWYRNNSVSLQESGMAIFSKFPIVKKQNIDIKSAYNSAIYADIKINDSIYRFFNLHLESNKITAMDNARINKIIEKPNNADLTETTKLLAQKLSEAAKIRAGQAEQIAELIKTSPHKAIVCGDFNDVPFSYTYSTVKKGLNDAFVKSGKGFGLTYDRGFYKLRIDYILCDKCLKTSDLQVDKKKHSDHYPVHCLMYFP